jgi:hypothetical protein
VNALETAVRNIMGLLIRREYEVVEKITRGRRLTASQLREAIEEYGRTLVTAPEEWWPTVGIIPIDPGKRPAFHVDAPLWTKEEGRSDLTLQLRLTETPQHIYESEVLDLHVL